MDKSLSNFKYEMGKVTFQNHIKQALSAIKLCIDSKFVTPALVLIYSEIDTMAWLSIDKDNIDVTKKNFIDWTNKYLISNLKPEITSEDLYAARCGTVHSGSPEARLIREGKAKPIYYSYGNLSKPLLNDFNENLGLNPQPKSLNLSDLFEALGKAISKFKKEILMNKTLEIHVYTKAITMFENFTEESLEDLFKKKIID